ncbi:MAG: hypothetical protein A2161_21935 [Candidatus Schekmanbacteria bacterium RBG_13_48_7]|uniref:Methyltransferase domain-containing protein n=1 Tax=Candidatus Schekmanbacteria bacterium RBG_13_48_7 TaxID=1817878 RepID=A0A1F7S0B2_9BACT|nr:MAG: hypothetical protein A2161_21935 [Candidatus Schekmanbacteria bacterium RBG_13_48_7]
MSICKTVVQERKRFNTTIDSILLAGFAKNFAKGFTLDLGTGNGVLPLLLSDSGKISKVVGIDLNLDTLKVAKNNIETLALKDRITFLGSDIREVPRLFRPNSFETVVVNPPYRKMNTGNISPYFDRAQSCHELVCKLDDVIKAAAHVLKNKGRFIIVFLPERLPELMQKLDLYRLAPKTMQMVHPYKDRSCGHVLVCARKNGALGLETLSPLIIYTRQGEYSPEMLDYYSYSSRFGFQLDKITVSNDR